MCDAPHPLTNAIQVKSKIALIGGATRGPIVSLELQMIFDHVIFKERPPNNSIRRLNVAAVTSRQQHLFWCKTRALAILETGDRRAAIASMLSDVENWEGGVIYGADELAMRRVEATFYTLTDDDIRDWINDFN